MLSGFGRFFPQQQYTTASGVGVGRCGMRSNIEVPVRFRRFRMHCTVPNINEGLEVLQVGEIPEVPGVVPDCLGGECYKTRKQVPGSRFLAPGAFNREFGSRASQLNPGVLRVCWICRWPVKQGMNSTCCWGYNLSWHSCHASSLKWLPSRS